MFVNALHEVPPHCNTSPLFVTIRILDPGKAPHRIISSSTCLTHIKNVL